MWTKDLIYTQYLSKNFYAHAVDSTWKFTVEAENIHKISMCGGIYIAETWKPNYHSGRVVSKYIYTRV